MAKHTVARYRLACDDSTFDYLVSALQARTITTDLPGNPNSKFSLLTHEPVGDSDRFVLPEAKEKLTLEEPILKIMITHLTR
jgi:hypothetical protein